MDWSKAKTIFIISFLILDIFLFIQLMNQKEENKFDLLEETSIDEQIKADKITLPELPKEPRKEYYVEVNIKHFSKDELGDIPGQDIKVINGSLIQSTLSAPFPLEEEWKVEEINQFVKSFIYEGDQYVYWDYNEEKKTITYYQVYKNKTFYQNVSGRIVLNLNDNNEIVSYSQTMLEDITEIKEQEIITADEAIAILYNRRLLKTGSEVTKAELGYYTLVPSTTSQLLAPTWRFTINGQDDLFVNAVEGHIFQVSEDNKSQVVE